MAHLIRAALALSCLLCGAATAQISQVPNTGCVPNAQYPATTGTGQVGVPISVQTTCPRGEISVAVIGFRPAPMTIPIGMTCGVPNCVLYPQMDLTWAGLNTWADTVQPGWVGLCMKMQFGCWDRTNLCLNLSGAVEIRFFP